VLLVLAVGFAAGCGGEEEVSPTPDTVTGTTETTDTTETTETTETTDTEEPVEGDVAAGRQVFLGASACGNCHTLADAGTSGTIGPNLDESQPDAALVVDRVTNGAGLMPAFRDSLSEEDIANVAAYVSTVAGD
jgi:mono/diheme cytochrome c family protein